MNPFWETLPLNSKKVLDLLKEKSLIKDFYLAGGTGLALQIGHRISRDLDFFTPKKFSIPLLLQKLSDVGDFQTDLVAEQSISGSLKKTKLSFLGYKYPLVSPILEMGGVSVAGIKDIACMKLNAIAARGTKRDFIDVYFIVKNHLSLPEAITLFQKKYSALNFNLMHLKKSLLYFDDADCDPPPQMLKDISWIEVKKFFLEQLKNIM